MASANEKRTVHDVYAGRYGPGRQRGAHLHHSVEVNWPLRSLL